MAYDDEQYPIFRTDSGRCSDLATTMTEVIPDSADVAEEEGPAPPSAASSAAPASSSIFPGGGGGGGGGGNPFANGYGGRAGTKTTTIPPPPSPVPVKCSSATTRAIQSLS